MVQKSRLLTFAVLVVALAVFLCTPHSRALESIHQLAQAVDNHYNHMRTFQAQFTEIYRGLGMERTESGGLWLEKGGLKKPGKMRWEYRSPEVKLFVSDGKDAWFYVPEDHQARRSDARKLTDLRFPLEFLLGKTQLEKELRGLSYAPDVPPVNADDLVLRGIPTGIEGRVSEMLLEVSPQRQIVRIEIHEADGSTTEYRFSDQKANVTIPPGWFHFQPPAGTEIIEGLEE